MKLIKILSIFSVFFLIILASCKNHQSEQTNLKGITTDKPGMNNYIKTEPGESSPLERAYEIAPPVIPHSVSEFKITKDGNDCLDCHLEGEEVAEGHIATKIPESHFVNKHTGEKRKDNVVGIRYNCEQCHVPQTNAKPLL